MQTKKLTLSIFSLIIFTNVLAIKTQDSTTGILMDTFVDNDIINVDIPDKNKTHINEIKSIIKSANSQINGPIDSEQENIISQNNITPESHSKISIISSPQNKPPKNTMNTNLNQQPYNGNPTKTMPVDNQQAIFNQVNQTENPDDDQVRIIARAVVPILIHDKGYEDLTNDQILASIDNYMKENDMKKPNEMFIDKVRSKIHDLIEVEIMDIKSSYIKQQKILRTELGSIDSVQDKAQFIITSINEISEKKCEDAVQRLFCMLPIREKLSEKIVRKPFIRKQTSVLKLFQEMMPEQLIPLQKQLKKQVAIQKPLSEKKYSEMKDRLEAMVIKARNSYTKLVKTQEELRERAKKRLTRQQLMYGKMIDMGKARDIMKKTNVVNIQNHTKMMKTRNAELKDKFKVLKNEFSEIKGLLEGKMDNFRKVDIAAKTLFEDQVSNVLGKDWVGEMPAEEGKFAESVDKRQKNVLETYGSNLEKYKQSNPPENNSQYGMNMNSQGKFDQNYNNIQPIDTNSGQSQQNLQPNKRNFNQQML